MWGKKEVQNVIPKELAITWHSIAKKLDRPPILSYASYALNNWKIHDPNKPFDVENIDILQNFLGGVDEDWFIMIHVAIEYEAKNLLSNPKTYFLDQSENIQQLHKRSDVQPSDEEWNHTYFVFRKVKCSIVRLCV